MACSMLDAHLRDMAVEYGTPDKMHSYQFPLDIADLPRRLYHLRRGPLLGPILQHPDDMECLRCLFLNSSYNDSLRIMEPLLIAASHVAAPLPPDQVSSMTAQLAGMTVSAGGQQLLKHSEFTAIAASDGSSSPYPAMAPSVPDHVRLEQLPLETLALQSDLVLLMDHFMDMFIWSGGEVAGRPDCDDLRLALVKRASALSVGRFPAPEMHLFKEGSSMSRLLFSRLGPAHKDAPHERVEDFPQLARLHPDQLHALISKFHRTDDPSFRQYYRNLFK